ncbi:DUF6225 family protein [Streptomyces sp. NPDC089919]|uniref:DUF6225 family protein n=1 Tax=Streptomyces sp. NPDC089919 TaxID=3155188 RepID=UPI003441DA07
MSDTTNIERYRHEAVELTVGELRDALLGLPADAPVRIDVPPNPRTDETRDSIDEGSSHIVVSAVVLNDADHLPRAETVLRADFASEWYVRPIEPKTEG